MRKIFTLSLIATILLCNNTTHAQSGYINTIAGNGTAGYSGDGGAATAAQLNHNSCIWLDNIGNLYIAEVNNNRIRKVNTAGIITTIAGNGTAGYSGDGGLATAAKLSYTQGVAVDTIGNVYIADQHNNRIRKVDISGIITTFAGNGTGGFSGDGGPASAALINQPAAVTVDNSGNVYICDQNNARIRKVDAFGVITTIAGGGSSGLGDGGAATAAQLNWPCNVSIDNAGNIFIADFQDNRIRKVNSSGIISTIAGTGVAGYSGDGGPATAAKICNHWGSVYPDNYGNIYIADLYNNRVRKIDNSGIITTIVGNDTAGYSGDGGPATSALLNEPIFVFINNSGDLYISDCANSVIRKVQYTPTYVADSFSVFVTNNCSGLQITDVTDSFYSSMYIKTYYGDGVIDSATVSSTRTAYFNHAYASSGVYTVKQLLYHSGVVIDSIQFSDHFQLCSNITLTYYIDKNNDCKFDTGDFLLSQPVLTEIDSNGTAIDTISSINGFYYTAYGNPGDIYTFKTISYPANMTLTCPSSDVIADTLLPSAVSSSTLYIGMQCSVSANNFSLSSYIPKHSQDEQWGWIYVNNTSCTDDATLTMAFSPNFTMESMVTTPYTVSGNTITWNLAGDHDSILSVFFKLNSSFMMTIGDTIQNHVKVTPLDPDTLNNYIIIVDTIQAGCDPNNMWVSPNGCIPYSASPTQLQYTISFMNTGNDTAYNIHILDTLSDNVDVSSMRMVMSSANMYISELKDSFGQNILKFDFPNINLVDSMHNAAKCAGTVIFTINTLPGLADGTIINNEAGVYFDYNPVVMTNQVGNINGCSPESVKNTQQINTITISPNPATNELTITVSQNAYTTFTITNSIGQQMLQQPLTQTQTTVNVSTLPPGLYIITFKGDSGTTVQKFLKE